MAAEGTERTHAGGGRCGGRELGVRTASGAIQTTHRRQRTGRRTCQGRRLDRNRTTKEEVEPEEVEKIVEEVAAVAEGEVTLPPGP